MQKKVQSWKKVIEKVVWCRCEVTKKVQNCKKKVQICKKKGLLKKWCGAGARLLGPNEWNGSGWRVVSATVRSDQGTRGRRRPRSQPGKGIQLQLLQPIINVGSKSKDGLKLILPRMRTFKRIEAAFKRTPPRTRVSVKLKSAGEEDVGKCCHLAAKNKHPSLNNPLWWDVTAWFGVTESRSHLLLWWTRGRQGQSTTAPDGQLSHFDSSEAVGLTKESPTKRPAKLTHNPLPNSSGFLQLASIFPGWWSGWITRGPRTWWRTATLWLALVGWLQGLPPPTSRPTSAGRYPPSQDSTAPVCNNRENPATCPIRSSATLNRSPRADCHNNQICLGPGGVGETMGLDTISPDKWEEKDGRTTWRQIFGNKCF